MWGKISFEMQFYFQELRLWLLWGAFLAWWDTAVLLCACSVSAWSRCINVSLVVMVAKLNKNRYFDFLCQWNFVRQDFWANTIRRAKLVPHFAPWLLNSLYILSQLNVKIFPATFRRYKNIYRLLKVKEMFRTTVYCYKG